MLKNMTIIKLYIRRMKNNIFKIINDIDNDVFVGSTKKKLIIAMCAYYDASKRYPNRRISEKINQLGIKHFKIELIEEYSYNNYKELLSRIQYWIDLLKPTLNEKLYIRTDEQNKKYYKDYYDNNKEKITNQNKKYKDDNKEWYKQYLAEYNEKNNDKLTIQRKNYRDDNKEYILKLNREYYRKNKDKIYEKHKCECGGQYTNHHKKRHLQTKKHLDWEAKIIS